jgi:small subunit ribosomal protein S17
MEQPNVEQSSAPVAADPVAPSAAAATTADDARNRRRIKQGVVRSDKMDKTIVVVTETRVPHPTYKKIVRKSVRFKAHDEKNDAKTGDTVRIMETRPMSRDKRWRLLEIVERAR